MSGVLMPEACICFGNCSAMGPTMTVKMASASFFSVGMYGPKSLVPRGGQIFWITFPPQSSNTRWKPPATSWPNA
jgi:hypothetical protein